MLNLSALRTTATKCCQFASRPQVFSRSFLIPTKKTNVVDVYRSTPRKIGKGTNALLEAEKQLTKQYDPAGQKSYLLSRKNPDRLNVGDVVRITKKDGVTFVGMTLAINRHNVSSTLLLRTKIQGTAVEMVYNIFNPEFTKVEIMRRALKEKKKAKLYYLRGNVKYDAGDLDAELRKAERRRK